MRKTRLFRMEVILKKEFDPFFLKIINESDKHIGHKNHDGTGETHYHIVIGSKSFEKHNRIEKERLINQSLKEEWQNGLHALSLEFISKESVDDYAKKQE